MLQTDDHQLWQLPFQCWDFFDRYPHAELGFSLPDYEAISSVRSGNAQVNILAILGDRTGIDRDRALLSELPRAATTFLVEPPLQSITD